MLQQGSKNDKKEPVLVPLYELNLVRPLISSITENQEEPFDFWGINYMIFTGKYRVDDDQNLSVFLKQI